MRYIYRNLENNDKENKIVSLYNVILEKCKNKSSKIMILVPNNLTKLKYEKKINIDYCEKLNITSYINFIKGELIKFWPIVLENNNEIKEHYIRPKFINNTLTDYIIGEKVKNKREQEGYFEDIISTNKSITSSISTNISKATSSKLEFENIGEKIYLSKKNKDSINKFSYSEMNEIIMDYTSMLLNKGMLDNSLSIYVYNKYLLKNDLYKEYLRKEIKYLIVESLESVSIAEIEFIKEIQENAIDSYTFFNEKRDFSVFNNIDIKFIERYIENEYEEEKYHQKEEVSIDDICSLPVSVELNESSQLYSEMIEVVLKKIKELMLSGVKAQDIAIISPINNTILDFQMTNKLKINNIDIFNTKKDKKLIDYPYANALIVALSIFNGSQDSIREEDYINFIETILDVNKIQALKIYKNKYEEEKFKEILNYIKDKRNEKLKIGEFLIKFYIDKMLNLKFGKGNIHICKKIIYECESFTENIELLNINEDKEKLFIKAIKTTINDYYQSSELEDLSNIDKVLLTTPYTYISSRVNRPIHIWLDVGSNGWNMKIEKDISNLIVLRKSFEEGRIYTDKMEEDYKKYYLYNTIYNLLINTKKVYAYKSEYTVNGYIQESILYSILLKMLDKGEHSYE